MPLSVRHKQIGAVFLLMGIIAAVASLLIWPDSSVVAALVSAILLLLLLFVLRWRIRSSTLTLSAANQRLSHLLDGSPAILYSLQPDGMLTTWVSSNIERILGFSPDQALQRGWWERQLHPDDREVTLHAMQALEHEHHQRLEYRLYDFWGKLRHIRDEMQFVPQQGKQRAEIIGTWTDLTPYHEQEARLSQLTHYDSLTNLANRTMLAEQLADMLDAHRNSGDALMVLYIDLDRFKQVNESLGTSTGDKVLRLQAKRIARLVGPDALLARMSADEFCAVLSVPSDQGGLELLLRALVARLNEPLHVSRHNLVVTGSIGISRYPRDAEMAGDLMMMAELSMVAAKKAGGNCWHFYEQELAQTTRARFRLENALRNATRDAELVLHYQPQFELGTGKLNGVEALVRWQHPELGLLQPGEFIPLAEQTGIIHEIDAWVLEKACRQLQRWEHQGFVIPRIAVNIAAVELNTSNLFGRVAAVLENNALDASRLELEITESMVMQAPESAIQLLKRLSAMGVCVALDDFGTGYSNLAYIGSLPLNRIKLDQTFVRRIRHSQSSEAVIRAIIKMAKELNLEVIAEGIEEAQEAEFLLKEACHSGQGYLLGVPQSADSLRRNFADLAQASG